MVRLKAKKDLKAIRNLLIYVTNDDAQYYPISLLKLFVVKFGHF